MLLGVPLHLQSSKSGNYGLCSKSIYRYLLVLPVNRLGQGVEFNNIYKCNYAGLESAR